MRPGALRAAIFYGVRASSETDTIAARARRPAIHVSTRSRFDIFISLTEAPLGTSPRANPPLCL